jgi:transmembrane sensor
MSAGSDPQTQRADEAAQWFARMRGTSVSNSELNDFWAWRRDPGNAEAYGAVERIWRETGDLKDSPAIKQAVDGLAGTVRKRRARRRAIAAGGMVLAGTLVGLFLVGQGLATQPKVFETAVGEQHSIVLDDGSRVKLDTDTRINVRYLNAQRLVTLERGQALFDVVHRPDRPFQVKVGATHIDDLGTVFDVRRDRDQVRVTLVSGAVQIHTDGPAAKRWALRPGQQLIASSQASQSVSVDPQKATSWTSGHLLFDNLPLSAATAEVNRYGRRKVILDAGAIGDKRVSGAFDSSDTDAFVSAVCKLYDLTVRHDANGSIILSAPTAKSSA